MTYDGERKHEWLFAHYICNASHCFAEVDLFRAEHGDGLSFETTIDECRAHYVDEIFNG